jgi:hypothetical protein
VEFVAILKGWFGEELPLGSVIVGAGKTAVKLRSPERGVLACDVEAMDGGMGNVENA